MDLTPLNIKFNLIASLSVDRFLLVHITINRGEEDITLSGIPRVIQEKVFHDLESRTYTQIGDAQVLILKTIFLRLGNPSLRRL